MQAGDRRCLVVYSTRNRPSITASRVPSDSPRDALEEVGVLEEEEVLGLEVSGSSLIAALEPEELLAAGLLLELEELLDSGLLLELEELLDSGLLLELEEELLEDAAASSEGSSFSEEELEELLEDELELEELEELLELTPLSKETCRVLLVTWLSL